MTPVVPAGHLEQPAIITVPLGFLGCVLGTLPGPERETEHQYGELFVRSEVGIGAEPGRPPFHQGQEPAAAPTGAR